MTPAIKLILSLSLLVNAAGGAIAFRIIRRRGGWTFVRSWLVARGVLRDEAKERFEFAYTANKLELFERLPVSPGDVLFVGDSLTDGGLWHELLADARCKNRGIAGDTSAGVLARFEKLLAGQPAVICLLVGVNDLLKGAAVETVAENHRQMLALAKARSPRTRLIVESCLPLDPVTLGEGSNEAIRALNARLRAQAEAAGVEYVDLYSAFERGGRLDPAVTHDGLHLNGAGYVRWRDLLPKL